MSAKMRDRKNSLSGQEWKPSTFGYSGILALFKAPPNMFKRKMHPTFQVPLTMRIHCVAAVFSGKMVRTLWPLKPGHCQTIWDQQQVHFSYGDATATIWGWFVLPFLGHIGDNFIGVNHITHKLKPIWDPSIALSKKKIVFHIFGFPGLPGN